MADQPDRPRLPLVADLANRDTSSAKDAKIINGFVEKQPEGDYAFVRRPGLAIHTDLASGDGRGIFNWKGDIYAVKDNRLFKNGVAVTGTVQDAGLYAFTSCLGGTPRLVLKNSSFMYTYDAGAGLVQVTDVDYPASTVYGVAYLDSTVYVMDASANIFGSALENPQSWDPLNKIVALSEPDGGVALLKHLSYVVALKEWSTEFFYDAANPAGSPLSRIDGLKLPYGCVAAESAVAFENDMIWAFKNRSGGVGVVHVNAQMQAQIISTKAIERLLQGANFSPTYAFVFKYNAHKMYVLSLPTTGITLVYDLTEGVWYYWNESESSWLGSVSATFSGQDVLLQHISDGDIYKLSAANTQDENGSFVAELISPIWDAGTTKAKTVTVMELVGDKYTSNTIDFRFSDNDYQTWTAYRTIDLSLGQAMIANLGTFRRRAYHFRHTASSPLRLRAAEHQIMLGVM